MTKALNNIRLNSNHISFAIQAGRDEVMLIVQGKHVDMTGMGVHPGQSCCSRLNTSIVMRWRYKTARPPTPVLRLLGSLHISHLR